jgi:hypothetical protein
LESNGLWTLTSCVKDREVELLVSCKLTGENLRPLDHRLDFLFMPDPNLLRESIALVREDCHVGILESNGLWTLTSSVKDREAILLVSYNLTGVNLRPLDLRPQCEAALSTIVPITLSISLSGIFVSYWIYNVPSKCPFHT